MARRYATPRRRPKQPGDRPEADIEGWAPFGPAVMGNFEPNVSSASSNETYLTLRPVRHMPVALDGRVSEDRGWPLWATIPDRHLRRVGRPLQEAGQLVGGGDDSRVEPLWASLTAKSMASVPLGQHDVAVGHRQR